jgi:hypothetical protein
MKIDSAAPIIPGISIGNISLGMHQYLFELELEVNLKEGLIYEVKKEESDGSFYYWIRLDFTSTTGDINVFIANSDLLVYKIGTGEKYKGNWMDKIHVGITAESILALELTPFIQNNCIYLQQLPGIRVVLPNEWDDIDDIEDLPKNLSLLNIQVLEPIIYCID